MICIYDHKRKRYIWGPSLNSPPSPSWVARLWESIVKRGEENNYKGFKSFAEVEQHKQSENQNEIHNQ